MRAFFFVGEHPNINVAPHGEEAPLPRLEP